MTPTVTQGVFIDVESGQAICTALELPWLGNQPNISCIPEGVYQVKPGLNSKGHFVFSLQDVKDRTEVDIHTGNTVLDIEGCILTGSEFGVLNGLPAVLKSRIAMAKLKEVVSNQPFVLEIKN